MTVTLSTETHQLLLDHMARHGYATVDEAIRYVFEATSDDAEPADELDADTVSALDRSEAESDHGDTVSWDELKAELKAAAKLP